jgi:hypothetical protein
MLRAPCQRVAARIMGVSSFRSLTAQLHSWSAQLGGTGCSEAGGVTSSSRREFAAAAGGDSNEEVRVRGIDMICSYTLLHPPQGPEASGCRLLARSSCTSTCPCNANRHSLNRRHTYQSYTRLSSRSTRRTAVAGQMVIWGDHHPQQCLVQPCHLQI